MSVSAFAALAIWTPPTQPAPISPVHPAAAEIQVSHPTPIDHIQPATGGTNPGWSILCNGAAVWSCPSPNSPVIRVGAMMTYDAADSYVLEFGGGHTATGSLMNTTYYWSNGAWHSTAIAVNGQITPAPSTLTARSNVSLAYDTSDGYVVMFGGYTGAGAYSQDTFKFLAGSWTKLFPTTRPQASAVDGQMVYVPLVSGKGGFVLLFGGKGKTNGTASNYYGYTWKFSAGQWTNISANVGTQPAARTYGSMAWDPTDGYALLEGGISPAAAILNDTWKFVPSANVGAFGGNWTQITATGAAGDPQPDFFGASTYITALTGVYHLEGAVSGTVSAPGNEGSGRGIWLWTGGSTNKWSNVSATVGFQTNGINSPKPGWDFAFADYPTASYAFYWSGETTTAAVSNASYALGNLLTVGFAETLGEVVVNHPTVLYANGSFGATPYAYSWTSLPSGCSTSNTNALTCSPNAAGVYTGIGAKVTGADGFNVSNTGLALTVDPQASQSGTVNIGPFVATEQYGFYSVRMTGTNLLNSTLAALFNATPYVYIRYGGGTDATNITNQSVNYLGCFYNNAGACGPPIVNYSMFKIFCAWVHCHSILSVPAETNDPGSAAITVRYVEQTLGFTPNYWSIGNEPAQWPHWNIPFAKWKNADNTQITPAQFGLETTNMTRAIRAIDKTTPIIGDEDAGGANSPNRVGAVATSSCANISAIAFHTYPGGFNTAMTASQFLSHANVSKTLSTYNTDLASITSGCGSNPVPQLFVHELNGANTNSTSQWLYGSAYDANFIAATSAMLLSIGCQQMTFFEFYSATSSPLAQIENTQPTPTYYEYSQVLSHFPMGSVYNATISTTMAGVWAVEGIKNGQVGLMVVNTNTSVALQLTMGSQFTVGNAPTVYTFDPTNGSQVHHYFPNGQGGPATPGSFTVGPASVAIFLQGQVSPPVGSGGGASPPLNVHEASSTSSTISLAWTIPAPNYVSVVIINYGLTCVSTQQIVVPGAITNYTLTGLAPGTSYCVTVQTVGTSGVYSSSQPVTVSTQSTSGLSLPPLGIGFSAPTIATDPWKLIGIISIGAAVAGIIVTRRWEAGVLLVVGVLLLAFA